MMSAVGPGGKGLLRTIASRFVKVILSSAKAAAPNAMENSAAPRRVRKSTIIIRRFTIFPPLTMRVDDQWVRRSTVLYFRHHRGMRADYRLTVLFLKVARIARTFWTGACRRVDVHR